MVQYDKKVIYLSEMEYGNRIKGAGFVKLECRGESCSFDMHISGMKTLAEKKYDISVISVWGKEYLIGRIFLHDGNGEWRETYEKGRVTAIHEEQEGNGEERILYGENRGEEGSVFYKEIAEILVKVSDTKALIGKTAFQKSAVQAAEISRGRTAAEVGGEAEGNTKERANIRENMSAKESMNTRENTRDGGIWKFVRGGREQMNKEERADMQEKERISAGKDEREAPEQENGMDRTGRSQRGEDKKKTEAGEEKKIQIEDVIRNDKWEQLKQIYSVVHPYEDDRQYIAIQPKDFVIMTGDYQHLANNSFLLHGFYNYRHIVLGRERDGCFYLGVPGVYYEREKMVALMFGFEAFECDDGKAEAGKFGYYLRKVKI